MMTFARHPDGSLVAEGIPHSNSSGSSLWRLPTRFLPDTAPAWLVLSLPFVVWAGVTFLLWRAVKSFR